MQSPETIVVGVSLGQESQDLLAWACNTAAQSGDHIIALHVIDHSAIIAKELQDGGLEKYKSSVAFGLTSLLDPLKELCTEKELTTQVRVVCGETLDKVLVEEAAALGATLLVLSTSGRRVAPWRIQGTASYCSRHAAPGCSVVVVSNKKILLYKEHRQKLSYDGSVALLTEDMQELLAKSRYKGLEAPFFGPAPKHSSRQSSKQTSPVKASYFDPARDSFSTSRLFKDASPSKCSLIESGRESFSSSKVHSKEVKCTMFELGRDSVDRASPISGCEEHHAEMLSPRNVLDGPGSFADSCTSSPSGSYNPGSWSPSNARKSLLSPLSSSSEEARHSVSERQQKPCLTLWKNMSMRRWHTFPSTNQKAPKRSPSNFLATSVLKLCNGPTPLSPSPSMDRDQAGALLCSALSDKPHWKFFTFEELAIATDNFNPGNIVGKGGYAEVYRGSLSDGSTIAVKKLIKGDTEEEKETFFLTELGIVSHVSHPNTTEIIGFCIEGGLHLVFHFYHHGSLAAFLYGVQPQVLDWAVRFKIAVGVARGLHYLHRQCPRRIIHRDIKASNILLGEDFEPQISDFGLAKWLPELWTHHTVTPVEGTFGYLAPEYFMHGYVDEKTDVFAYGVLLLELITGRRSINAAQQSLVMWARPLLDAENVQELVDPRLAGAFDSEELHRVVLAATLCVRQSSVWRPCMSQVLSLLVDGELEADLPDAVDFLARKSSECGGDSSRFGDNYSSDNYSSDMHRHRALALEF
ncbi:protein MpRLK-Pelle_RLCK-Vib [Marchantia polymorpha subsp. ruderalis]